MSSVHDELMGQVVQWRTTIGVQPGPPSVEAVIGEQLLSWSAGTTVSLAALVASDGGPPEEVELAEAMARLVSAR